MGCVLLKQLDVAAAECLNPNLRAALQLQVRIEEFELHAERPERLCDSGGRSPARTIGTKADELSAQYL